jgi:hypothetical protein
MPENRNPWEHEITIAIDEASLPHATDQTLAVWWHVAQANPADGMAASEPGNLAETIGREIIRRWLAGVPPELWHHQGRHYYWHELTKPSRPEGQGTSVPDAPADGPGRNAGPQEAS